VVTDKPTVWIVDADHWPRAELRALLIEQGYDAVGFETLRDAVLRLRLPGARPPAAFVVNLIGQDVGDALLAALAAAHVPVVAIGGAVEAEDPRVRAQPFTEFLRRPITIGEIAGAAARVVGAGLSPDTVRVI
jgi:hypothetical protein